MDLSKVFRSCHKAFWIMSIEGSDKVSFTGNRKKCAWHETKKRDDSKIEMKSKDGHVTTMRLLFGC